MELGEDIELFCVVQDFCLVTVICRLISFQKRSNTADGFLIEALHAQQDL